MPERNCSRSKRLQSTGEYAVVILDLLMPTLSGLDVCKILRAESDMPIIMLTARDTETDRVLGLELGADDYLTKPFSSAELVSRVRALLRRRDLDLSARATAPQLTVGGIQIDLARHRVTVDGNAVELTPSEFKLLVLLAEEPERVFSRTQIMEQLWDSPYVGAARACDVHISNLRKKVERDPSHPKRVVTVREAGYKLMPA
jgi:two-component system response regulator RegX3